MVQSLSRSDLRAEERLRGRGVSALGRGRGYSRPLDPPPHKPVWFAVLVWGGSLIFGVGFILGIEILFNL